MAETTNEPPDPGSAVTSDSEVLAAIRADVETELAHLEASDPHHVPSAPNFPATDFMVA